MPWTTSFIAALLRDTPVIRFLFVGAGAAGYPLKAGQWGVGQVR